MQQETYSGVKEVLATENADCLAGHHVAEADGARVVSSLDELRVLGQQRGGQGRDDLLGGSLRCSRHDMMTRHDDTA